MAHSTKGTCDTSPNADQSTFSSDMPFHRTPFNDGHYLFLTQKVRDHACNLAYNIFDGVVVLILLFCYYEYVQKYGERNLKDKEC